MEAIPSINALTMICSGAEGRVERVWVGVGGTSDGMGAGWMAGGWVGGTGLPSLAHLQLWQRFDQLKHAQQTEQLEHRQHVTLVFGGPAEEHDQKIEAVPPRAKHLEGLGLCFDELEHDFYCENPQDEQFKPVEHHRKGLGHLLVGLQTGVRAQVKILDKGGLLVAWFNSKCKISECPNDRQQTGVILRQVQPAGGHDGAHAEHSGSTEPQGGHFLGALSCTAALER